VQQKKPYVSPTLTVHGGAVEKTLGNGTKRLEFINWYNWYQFRR
jgi:hypothetical protein